MRGTAQESEIRNAAKRTNNSSGPTGVRPSAVGRRRRIYRGAANERRCRYSPISLADCRPCRGSGFRHRVAHRVPARRAVREIAPHQRAGAEKLRGVRVHSDGVVQGYVAEQTAWASELDVPSMPDKRQWRIVLGRHFLLHDPEQAMTYWCERLPDTPVTWMDDAGQMLAYSHSDAVVRELCSYE